MHFWLSTARLYGRVPVPRKTSLNWFMPAFVNKSVGSSSGTTLDDGTAVWPCFLTKKSMNCWRISLDVGMIGNPTDRSWPGAPCPLYQEAFAAAPVRGG